MTTSTHLPRLLIYGATDQGQQRTQNEDRLSWTHATARWGHTQSSHLDAAQLASHGHLLVIADGVGGNDHGELASQTTVQTLLRSFYSQPQTERCQQLEQAIQQTTQAVYQVAAAQRSNAASTLVVATIWEEAETRKVLFANVGDSRGYLFRASDSSTPAQQTVDHTERKALQQSMGDPQVQPHYSNVYSLEPDDVIVLCSDGLSDLVEPQEIEEIVRHHTPWFATRRLIRLANARGGHDNITVLIARNGISQQHRRRPLLLTLGVLCFVLWLWIYTAISGAGIHADQLAAAEAQRTAATHKQPESDESFATVTLLPATTATPLLNTTTPIPVAQPHVSAPPAAAPQSTRAPQKNPAAPTPSSKPDTPSIVATQPRAINNPAPDTDRDGYPDRADGCPTTPQNPQGRDGCPDTDGDTVPDRDDACPTQAGAPAERGCPVVPTEKPAPTAANIPPTEPQAPPAAPTPAPQPSAAPATVIPTNTLPAPTAAAATVQPATSTAVPTAEATSVPAPTAAATHAAPTAPSGPPVELPPTAEPD